MKLFGNLGHKFLRFFNLGVTDPKAWDSSLWRFAGSQSEPGETVTEETALSYSAVFNAISLISGTVGSLPLHLMQKQGKKKRISEEKDLYRLLHDRPNPYMTAISFRQTLTAHMVAWGNGYAEIQRNGYGDVVALWPIAPNRVVNIEMRESGLWYEIRVGNEQKWLPRNQILHIPGLGFDGFVGYSVIAMARKSIGLGMAMETFGSRLFSQGMHPSATLTIPSNIKDVKAVRDAYSEIYSGLGNTHRLMLVEDGMKFDKIGIPPEDSQFLESRQFQIPEIARWFNLPPHKLKDLTKSSFNNIEAEQASFVTDSILYWVILEEQNFNNQLLSEGQRTREKLYFKHVLEGLLRANSKDRAEFYRAMIGSGIMTPNEAREKEDLDPVQDALADELWMPTGLIPMSRFDEYLSKNNSSGDQKTEEKTDSETKNPLKLITETKK